MTNHSRERAQQRYNLELSQADETNIMNILRSGRGIPLNNETKSDDKKFAYVTYKNIPMKVLYAWSRIKGVKSIVTAYPFDVEEYNRVQQETFDDQIKMAIKFLQKNNYIVYKKPYKRPRKIK